ncbi:MAG: hypothetical protein A2754_01240 [Candidatus Magasanikbacteria bacterium RIFCSPHIGHO2_01_FULL_47_8]|uniref:Uncharacterized protein n=1 Tax=Candidatus Magasanikbacteria bacterium RIFCSPHIGHO2_01_FULL_47_8 TaxID=1798673 RepID=A0A1F6MCV1_9BACT|nr:MAG: hypothetical protein A2754_01240 [Candidatus Magasanikbacteria bacterium RIFCSPHIGHO2_01_FULL_47_8]
MSERNSGGGEQPPEANVQKVGESHAWDDPGYARAMGWVDENGKLTEEGVEELIFRQEQLEQQRQPRSRAEIAEGPVKNLDQKNPKGSLRDNKTPQRAGKPKEKTIEEIVKQRAAELEEKPYQRILGVFHELGYKSKELIKYLKRDGTSKKFKLTLAIGKNGYEEWTGTAEELEKRIRKNFKEKTPKDPEK